MKINTMSDVELGRLCLEVLVREVGSVEAERFIAYINRERFDYTKWQRNLFQGDTIDEIADRALRVGRELRKQMSTREEYVSMAQAH